MTPAEIKAWLDSGLLKIVGHQVIDGHQTIGLRQPWARGYREMWVDSTTFLPVQLIMADFADQKGPLQNDMLIDNETWLPRTSSLLNQVNKMHIPAGFKPGRAAEVVLGGNEPDAVGPPRPPPR